MLQCHISNLHNFVKLQLQQLKVFIEVKTKVLGFGTLVR